MKYTPIMLALLTAALAGCGTTPDARPPKFNIVVLEVLAPSCGQVQCHSTTTNISGYAFDTLEAAAKSLATEGKRNQVLDQMERRKMPPDAPMADEDIALVRTWIDMGAPGL